MADNSISRRAFLFKSAALTAALAIAPHRRVLGANDDVRVAIVGVGNKGSQHVGMFKKVPGVSVVALCDPDSERLKAAMEKHFADAGEKPQTYSDIRKVLDDKSIDAICVATPNHWHALATVWACQAGKDVYVEKPCSHTIYEGQQMIAAAKKYGRVVQVGTQSRSDSGLQNALQYIKQGGIGDIEYIRGIYYNLREPIGKVSGPQQPPASVDYTLWQGPVPEAPLMREKLHYDWHWQWPYGNGELGNNMVHMLDLATWFLDIKDYPRRVMSVGNRFQWDDDGQTPNAQVVYYDYEPVPVICELRNLPRFKGDTLADNILGLRVGIVVKGKDGQYAGYNTGGWIYDNKGKRQKQFKGDGGGSHQQNFIDAVRARKPEMLKTNIHMGALDAALCHMGNISHRLGAPADGKKIMEAAEGAPVLQQTLCGMTDHLLVNNVDVQKWPRQLGPWVTFDGAAGKFTGDQADAANKYLKETYRPGFEVPDLA